MDGGDLEWYKFYGFETIDVYVDEIKTDQTGVERYLKTHGTGDNRVEGVNNSVIVHVAEVASPATPAESVKNTDLETGNVYYEYNIEDPATLDDYVLYYENHSGVAQNFNLYVPVAIKYWWGTIKTDLKIPVVATIAD